MSNIIPDFTHPSVIQEADAPIPNCLVQSCTECCRMVNPDGTPNMLGPLHRKQYTRVMADGSTLLDCGNCPVHLSTYTRLARTGDGKAIYWKGTDKRLTEADLLRLEEDGDYLKLYVDIR